MKRWAVLTVLLYGLVLVAFTWPVLVIFATDVLGLGGQWSGFDSVGETFRLYREWGYWLWLGILIAGQALLLLVPVDMARPRLPSRRRLALPVAVAAFFMANIVLAGVFSLLCLVFGDDASKVIEFLMHLALPESGPNLITEAALQQAGSQGDSYRAMAVMAGLLLAFWGVWAMVFSRFADARSPDALMDRLTRWLLRGSILEVLVAVPSHIVVRHRNDCCAPIATFWGIVTGLSIMFLAFGPSVFYLFARRFRRSRPRDEVDAPRLGPD